MNCPEQSIIPAVFMYAIIAGIVILYFWSGHQRRIDSRYGCSKYGGRDGHISITHNGRTALVDFELGVKGVDLIIYDSYLRWIGTNQKDMTDDDRAALMPILEAWCKAKKYKIELESTRVA